jgi:hypothetical protein
LFEDLDVRASTKAGIKVLGTAGIPTRVRVTGCTFRETFWHGVDFADGVSESVIVHSEFVRTNRTTEGASIYFSGETCASNQAVQNRISDSGDNGIRVKGTGNVVRGNTVDRGRTDGIRDEGMETLVSDNTIRAPDEVCIKVGRGARDSTVEGNTCLDAGTDNDGNKEENGHGILTYTDLGVEKRVDGAVIRHKPGGARGAGDCIHLEKRQSHQRHHPRCRGGEHVCGRRWLRHPRHHRDPRIGWKGTRSSARISSRTASRARSCAPPRCAVRGDGARTRRATVQDHQIGA